MKKDDIVTHRVRFYTLPRRGSVDHKILNYLYNASGGSATIREIAAATKYKPNDVSRTMVDLVKNGAAAVKKVEPNGGRGKRFFSLGPCCRVDTEGRHEERPLILKPRELPRGILKQVVIFLSSQDTLLGRMDIAEALGIPEERIGGLASALRRGVRHRVLSAKKRADESRLLYGLGDRLFEVEELKMPYRKVGSQGRRKEPISYADYVEIKVKGGRHAGAE